MEMERIRKALQDSMEKHERALAQQDTKSSTTWSMEERTETIQNDTGTAVCICGYKIGEPHSHRRNAPMPREFYAAIVMCIIVALFILNSQVA